MTVDMSDCKHAPLNRIGEIQPHGCLLALNKRGLCIAASENVDAVFGGAAKSCIGLGADAFIECEKSIALIQGAQRTRDGEHVRSQLQIRGASYQCLVHQVDSVAIMELQANLPANLVDEQLDTSTNADRVVFIHELQSLNSAQECAERLLQAVADLGGFDRNMLYRFSPDWHGEVVAEQLRGPLSGFLGLRFPADDIPPNARQLYSLNPVRLIPDVSARPVCLAHGEPDGEIDLTYSRLRAVHPVHLDYLRNMQAAASFSLSLVCNGVLWGMIACHHATPRMLTFDIQCELEEYLAIASMQMSALNERARTAQHHAVEKACADLRQQVNCFDQRHLRKGVFDMIADIKKTFGANGCWISLEGQTQFNGNVPGVEAANLLLQWFRSQSNPICCCYSELPETLRAHDELKQLASGALFIPLLHDDFIMLMRQEVIENVQWAGRADQSPNEKESLSPRSSFAQWEQVLQFHCEPWPQDLQHEAKRFCAELNDLLTTAHFAGLAFTDALTGLANRARLQQFLDESIQKASTQQAMLAVYFLDLDGFKTINDELGHQVGDQLLRIVARRLERLMRGPDLLARLGGDEFIIVQAGLTLRSHADAVIRRIKWALGQEIKIGSRQVHIEVTVGFALYPDDAQDADSLMMHADMAMYRHKTQRKSPWLSRHSQSKS